jgi:hypothetical protein
MERLVSGHQGSYMLKKNMPGSSCVIPKATGIESQALYITSELTL